MNREDHMTDRIEAERLGDGRLRITLDATSEAALLTMAGLACDIVTAPREVDPEEVVDRKIGWLQERTEQLLDFTASIIYPPPPREGYLPDELDAEIDRAQNAGEDFPQVWLPTGDGGGRWWSVCAVSTRKASPHAFLHVLTDEGVGLANEVPKAERLTVRRAVTTGEGVAA